MEEVEPDEEEDEEPDAELLLPLLPEEGAMHWPLVVAKSGLFLSIMVNIDEQIVP